MKKFIQHLTKNWIAKLICLIVATIVWFLIDKQLGDDQPRLYRDTLHNDTWPD